MWYLLFVMYIQAALYPVSDSLMHNKKYFNLYYLIYLFKFLYYLLIVYFQQFLFTSNFFLNYISTFYYFFSI